MHVKFWETHFYTNVLTEADDILKEWDPYIEDESYISDSLWTMANTKSSIRNENNDKINPQDISLRLLYGGNDPADVTIENNDNDSIKNNSSGTSKITTGKTNSGKSDYDSNSRQQRIFFGITKCSSESFRANGKVDSKSRFVGAQGQE